MIHTGDCIEVMHGMPADSVDAVVTDPPYAMTGAQKPNVWAKSPEGDPFRRTNRGGFMGKQWDAPGGGTPSGFQAWCEAWGREALRVTKPGGYLLAFGGTRTHHRLVCGLEDAGWIIRDELDWIYASGFPKGRANLKPAHEPIVLARKPGPLRPLGIDAARIPTEQELRREVGGWQTEYVGGESRPINTFDLHPEGIPGRWPSNLLLSDPALFDEPNPEVVGSGATAPSAGTYLNPDEEPNIGERGGGAGDGFLGGLGQRRDNTYANETGGYSRFFLVPKSSRADREPVVRGQVEGQIKASYSGGVNGTSPRDDNFRSKDARENLHPTVKPTDLMRHLVRLVTPSGGTVLDPFLGSGSTALACELEGFPWIGIEQSAEYVAIAEARLNGTQRGLGLDVGAPTRKAPREIPDIRVGRHGGGEDWFAWGRADEEPVA